MRDTTEFLKSRVDVLLSLVAERTKNQITHYPTKELNTRQKICALLEKLGNVQAPNIGWDNYKNDEKLSPLFGLIYCAVLFYIYIERDGYKEIMNKGEPYLAKRLYGRSK